MKRFTTSAQKTLPITKDEIIEKLSEEMSKDLAFTSTKNKYIKEAKLKDGSKVIIAAFDKENSKSLAMIDHKLLPETVKRSEVQEELKSILNKVFS